jgi:predicted acyltransferase
MKLNDERLLSLDVFRGLTIAGMILVNNPGSWQYVYPPLRHAAWNGCTPTDLIFPFFLFIVGVSITLSLEKKKSQGAGQKDIILKILKRTLLIFLIGLFLNTFPSFDLSRIRIPGVLQRIAVVYMISSFLFLKAGWKTISVAAFLFLVFYWLVIAFFPVPGIGAPNLNSPLMINPHTGFKAPGNIAGWIDNKLLSGHLWGSTKVWDPEGLLSTIPAVSTCLIGILAGYFLKSSLSGTKKALWFLIAGNVFILAAFIWNLFLPFNKSLWTSSFVLLTGGIALWLFGLIFWAVDVKKSKWWIKPFCVYGTNAIAVYFLSGIFIRCINYIKISEPGGGSSGLTGYLYYHFFVPNFSSLNASLAWAVSYVLFWLAVMWVFYSKKIFIKI